MKTLRWVLPTLGLLACSPRLPASSEGYRCDDAQACTAGLLCVNAVCQTPDPQPQFPIRLATFQGDYPDAWRGGTTEHPSLGEYNSFDADVVRAHVTALRYGNFDAALFSWDGPGTPSAQTLKTALQLSPGSGLHWGFWAQQGLDDDVDATLAASTLAGIDTFSQGQPNLLELEGRVVVFVASPHAGDSCALAALWVPAAGKTAHRPYLVLRARSDDAYLGCPQQPDAWYAFDSENRTVAYADSFSVSPGFVVTGKPPNLARDLAQWQEALFAMAASKAKFQVVTSFNDWPHGNEVESATEWATGSGQGGYLDALHELSSTRSP